MGLTRLNFISKSIGIICFLAVELTSAQTGPRFKNKQCLSI